MGGFQLNGRVALITGGAQGAGAGIAQAFAAAGAAVMIGDVLEEAGRETAATAAEKHGVNADFFRMDITQDADWQAATAQTIKQFGGFDILINNAGIGVSALMIDADPDDLRLMLDVNVVGAALGIKHAFRAMRPGGPAGRGGVIVNISSIAATGAVPGTSGYAASKSAVDRLTRVAAAESSKLGYGVRVNCIYPGLASNELGTDLTADMADAVVFFASEASRFVTGNGLGADGDLAW